VSVCERTAVLLNIAAATNRKQSELICLYERVRLDKEAAMRGAKGCEAGGRGGEGGGKGIRAKAGRMEQGYIE